jgi:hypothetical protein
MVIEKLTKWHHGSELQLLSETSAHQMNENPSVILLTEDFILQYFMFLLYFLKTLPFLLETFIIHLCSAFHSQVFELIEVALRPKSYYIDIFGKVIHHVIPDVGGLLLAINVQQICVQNTIFPGPVFMIKLLSKYFL